MLKRLLIGLCSLVFVSPAFAGGLEFNQNSATILSRSGAFTAKADHPMAIYYNPGGLTLLKGHKLYLGSNLNYISLKYTRTGIDDLVISDSNPDGIYTSATVENETPLFVAPSLAYVYGGGKWAVGLGVFGPGAHGRRKFDPEGPQRFMLTESDFLLVYGTLSGAYQITDTFSIGISLQYTAMPKTLFKVTIDGGTVGAAPSTEDNPLLSDSTVDMTNWEGFTAIVGMHWRPTKNLELGLSSRIIPIYTTSSGTVDLKFPHPSMTDLVNSGKLSLVDKSCDPTGECPASNRGVLKLTLPPWVSFGIRYVDRDKEGDEVFDIELDFVVEFWSMLEGFDVNIDAKLLFITSLNDINDFSLPKQYRDTFALRLGSSVRLIPKKLTLHAGLHYESPAVNKAYAHLDFVNFHRIGASLGFTLKLKPVTITLAYQFVYQPPYEVSEDEAKLTIIRPMSEPTDPLVVNAGTYNAMYHTTSVGLVFSF